MTPNDRDENALLHVNALDTRFITREGVVRAVDGVSLTLNKGETLGVVGESGCGKSVMALSILRLLPTPPAQVLGGPIWFQGADLLTLSEREMRRIRGNKISMIFQEPMTSLTPVLTIGRQMREVFMLHQHLRSREANRKVIEMLDLVQIPEPQKSIEQYPHELSGGMRQRVMIAMALSCDPMILIADEPTTALDVTIQAQILDLMNDLKKKTGTAVIMITHDLGVIAETAQRVMVMYAGMPVEEASVMEIFNNPLHPYTRGLLGSLPRLGRDRRGPDQRRLTEIPGMVPSLKELPSGCCFAPRCFLAKQACYREVPLLEEKEAAHRVACWEIGCKMGANP
jgi:peptide/nickel transport system ATP-binding protein